MPGSDHQAATEGVTKSIDLSKAHRHMLEVESGISTELIEARGYRTVTTKADLKRLGFSAIQQNTPALLIPIYHPCGEIATYQARPDNPRIKKGKAVKYETPSGSSMALDVHPSVNGQLADPATPLFITEGIKKGDALVSHGLTTIALIGVWNWRGKNDKGGKTALADWEDVALNGRRIYIVFDSDVMLKESVHAALVRLKAFLESRKSRVALIYLPHGAGASKCGVDDFLVAGHSVDELLALATSELHATAKPEAPPNARPEIVTNNRHLRDISEEALGVLDGLDLYSRAELVVRVNGAKAERLTNAALKGILERAADFVKEVERDGQIITVPARVPSDLPPDILSLPAHDLPFPKLEAIAHAPVMLPSGVLLSRNGYDEDSGILLDLKGLTGLRSDMKISEALIWLDDLLGDFPFVDEASRAHALGLLIQPTVRQVIRGPTPLYMVDAPLRGTGKGLLIDVCVMVQTGRAAPIMPLNRDGEELDKRITTLLLDGSTHVLLDNVTEIKSTVLAAVLTSEVWRGRILGKSEMVHVRNDATWITSGNNIDLSDEITRRVMPIRLDAGVERPEERGGFRHPKLKEWALEYRCELLSAVLSLVRAWADAGMPKAEKSLGSFESWAAVMGGILEVAGVSGLLGGRERLHTQADRETTEWAAFLIAWHETHGTLTVTARDLFAVLKERRLLLDLWGGRSDIGAMQRLGHALKARRDRMYGNLKIVSAGQDSTTGNAAYRLEPSPANGAGRKHLKHPKTPEKPLQAQTDDRCFSVDTKNTRGENPVTDSERRTAGGVSGVFTCPAVKKEAAGHTPSWEEL